MIQYSDNRLQNDFVCFMLSKHIIISKTVIKASLKLVTVVSKPKVINKKVDGQVKNNNKPIGCVTCLLDEVRKVVVFSLGNTHL